MKDTRSRPAMSETHHLRAPTRCESSDSRATGRRYHRKYAQGGVDLEHLRLATKLSMAGFDGLKSADRQDSSGDRQRVNQELLQIHETLQERFGFTADRAFHHEGSKSQNDPVATEGFVAHRERTPEQPKQVVLAYGNSSAALRRLSAADGGDWVPFAPVKEAGRQQRGLQSLLACGIGMDVAKPFVNDVMYEAFLPSLEDIDGCVLPHLQTSEPIQLMVTGHGFGGALATQAVAYIFKKFDFLSSPHSVCLVTTGQPKVGDAKFAQLLDREAKRLAAQGQCTMTRLVSTTDVVPLLPLGHGHKHWSGLCLLTSMGELIIDPCVEERLQVKDQRAFIMQAICHDARDSVGRYLGTLQQVNPEPKLHQPRAALPVLPSRCGPHAKRCGVDMADTHMVHFTSTGTVW